MKKSGTNNDKTNTTYETTMHELRETTTEEPKNTKYKTIGT